MIHVYSCFRWFIPFIGHMGICTSAGVIRDFAGPYFVSVSHIQNYAISFKCIKALMRM